MKTSTKDQIVELMIKAKAIETPDEIRADVTFKEQGIDSLDMFNVFLLIEESLGVDVADDDVDQLTSLDAVVAYVEARMDSEQE